MQTNKQTHCKYSQHKQIKKRTANTHNTNKETHCKYSQHKQRNALQILTIQINALQILATQCCEYLQCVYLFVCVVSICSVFICLCCEYLQCVSLFVSLFQVNLALMYFYQLFLNGKSFCCISVNKYCKPLTLSQYIKYHTLNIAWSDLFVLIWGEIWTCFGQVCEMHSLDCFWAQVKPQQQI